MSPSYYVLGRAFQSTVHSSWSYTEWTSLVYAVKRSHFLYVKTKLDRKHTPAFPLWGPPFCLAFCVWPGETKTASYYYWKEGLRENAKHQSFLVNAFNTLGWLWTWGHQGEIKIQTITKKGAFPVFRILKSAQLPLEKQFGNPCSIFGAPFLAGWLAIPSVRPLVPTGSGSHCGISKTGLHLHLQMPGAGTSATDWEFSVLLQANLALPGISRLYQPRKRSPCALLCVLWRWPETIVKNEQRDYKLICFCWLLWWQRYD